MTLYSATPRIVFLCYLALVTVAADTKADENSSNSILGTWQNTSDPLDLRQYQAENIYQSNKNGELAVFPVSGYSEGRIVIPDLAQGMRRGIVMQYTLDQDLLTITQGRSIMNGSLKSERNITLKRVTSDVADMSLKAFPTGLKKKNLDKKTTKTISQNLIARMQRDQQSRSSGKYGKKAIKEQKNDYIWLKETITQHGWIDTKRFGSEAVRAAFLIAQHCVDMRLRLAAQQGLKKDMESGSPVHGMYAWLYDRNRLFCRGNQRYGTHYRQIQSGAIEILPLESVFQIDSWRKKARLSSLASLKESLAQLSPENRVIIADALEPANKQ